MQKYPAKSDRHLRDGVTLTEVLMSLMIMAIGVTSVVSLFPVATLRSAQATKITNSAVLKLNLEAELEVIPEVIYDPDGDGDLNEHYVGGAGNRNYVVDPIGFHSMFEYSNDLGAGVDGGGNVLAQYFGHDPSNNDVSGIRRFDGGVFRSLFDPTTTPLASLNDNQRRALRLTAQRLASLGDNWETIYDFTPDELMNAGGGSVPNDGSVSAGTIAGVRIPNDVVGDAASAALIPTSVNTVPAGVPGVVDPEVSRVVIFSADGEFSQTFPLLSISNALMATWSEAVVGTDLDQNGNVEARGLPREFRLANANWIVGRVLIQQQKSVDFNWLLTVRRTADGRVRGMDVVIKFGEEVAFEDESLHVATNTEDLNGNGMFDSGEDLDGDGVFDNPYPPTVVMVSNAAEPALSRGGFIFDTGSARWHRIRDVEEIGANSRVTLERPAAQPFSGAAVVLPGVVDVFSMGSRSIPDALLRGF